MRVIAGELLTEEGWVKAFLECPREGPQVLRKGTPPVAPSMTGLFLQGVVNAHTHIGDAFIRKRGIPLPRSVRTLVAPPDGLKHRLLKSAPEDEVLAGMQDAMQEMAHSGTRYFCDFREGGLAGIRLLRQACMSAAVTPIILARPKSLRPDPGEASALLQHADGIAVSSVSDWAYADLEDLATLAKKHGKLFALHASEAVREDISKVLALDPDFLVHLTAATKEDLHTVAEAAVPCVLCPRTYQFFGMTVDYAAFKASGLSLMLGSDNAMLAAPDVLQDLRLLRDTGLFALEDLLAMVTFTPRKALKINDRIQPTGPMETLVVLDKQTLNPLGVSPCPTTEFDRA